EQGASRKARRQPAEHRRNRQRRDKGSGEKPWQCDGTGGARELVAYRTDHVIRSQHAEECQRRQSHRVSFAVSSQSMDTRSKRLLWKARAGSPFRYFMTAECSSPPTPQRCGHQGRSLNNTGNGQPSAAHVTRSNSDSATVTLPSAAI